MSYEAHTVNGVKLYEPKPGNPIVKIFDADKVEPEVIQIFINQLTDKVDGFGTEVFVTEGDKEVWIYDNGNIDSKEIVDEFETLRAELQDEEIEGLDKPYIVIQSEVVEENKTVSADYIYDQIYSIHGRPEDFDDGDLNDRIYNNNSYEYSDSIPMSKISLDEWYVDEDYVDELVDEIKDKHDYEPIVVAVEPGITKYTIVDGIHRLNALDKLGYKEFKGYIGKSDVVEESVKDLIGSKVTAFGLTGFVTSIDGDIVTIKNPGKDWILEAPSKDVKFLDN